MRFFLLLAFFAHLSLAKTVMLENCGKSPLSLQIIGPDFEETTFKLKKGLNTTTLCPTDQAVGFVVNVPDKEIKIKVDVWDKDDWKREVLITQ